MITRAAAASQLDPTDPAAWDAAINHTRRSGLPDLLIPVDDGRGYGSVAVQAEMARRLKLLNRAEGDEHLQRLLTGLCSADPHFFFDHFVWTEDAEAAAADDLPAARPLVPWTYQRDLVSVVCGVGPHGRDETGRLRPVILDKSRKLGATWLVLGCLVWRWLFEPSAALGVMTRSGTDLDTPTTQSLFGKLCFIIRRLPPWLTPDGFTFTDHRRRMPAPVLVNPANGSSITGSRTVTDAFRGGRLRQVFVDEGASVPKLAELLTSLQDVAEAPVIVSTPKGRGNHFASIVHGEAGEVHRYGEPERSGWCHLRLHYSSHPERDPETEQGRAWIEREKALRTPKAWAQEQEIDYDVSAPGRIFPEFDATAHVYTSAGWAHRSIQRLIPGLPVFEGWDFGSGKSLCAVVWAAYEAKRDRLWVIDYRVWQSTPFVDVARDVGVAGWYTDAQPQGRLPTRRVGDVAGTQRESDQRSWIANLSSLGIEIEGRLLQQAEGLRDRMRIAFREGRIYFAPACTQKYGDLPTLVESVQQYRRNPKTQKPEKKSAGAGKYSHLADALQHIAEVVWPGQGGQMRVSA